MPFVTDGSRRIGRAIAAAIGLALLAASPASAVDVSASKAPPSNPDGCVAGGPLSTPFTAWDDLAGYELAPGGDFETGAEHWTLTKDAALAAENRPQATGAASLQVPAGATATSPPMCVDSTYPHFRFFARRTAAGKSGLKVSVLYLGAKGGTKSTTVGEVVGTSTDWALTDRFRLGLNFDEDQAAPVRFHFAAGKDSSWRIDDLYVDPYGRS